MSKFKAALLAASTMALIVAAPVRAESAPPASSDDIVVVGHPQIGTFGVDLTARDTTAKPGDDFERYASGTWIDKTTIPSDRPNVGSFTDLREEVQSQAQELITKAPAGTKYGALYAAFMDEKQVERAGLKPLMADLAELRAITDKSQFSRYMASTYAKFGITLINFGPYADSDNPNMNVLWVNQGGLGLPEKDYYFNAQFAKQRAAYYAYIERTMRALGNPDPKGAAAQIMAFETDLLEHDDIFDGSAVISAKVEDLKAAARAEMAKVSSLGGAASLKGLAYMKEELVASNTARLRAIESGETKVVGVNVFTSGEPSPLAAGNAIMTVKDDVEFGQIERLKAWRAKRDAAAVERALAALKEAAKAGRNIMEPSIACAKAGVTTGEWGQTLRAVFGEFRAPTGVSLSGSEAAQGSLEELRARVAKLAQVLGTQPRFLVGKPGLDGHSNGAEQIARRAADIGLAVVYDGIRMTPDELVARAEADRVHILGLSILSGSHVPLVREVMQKLRARNISAPVVVGGIIPEEDAHVLKQLGVAAVYTPKDYDLNRIMDGLVGLVERSAVP